MFPTVQFGTLHGFGVHVLSAERIPANVARCGTGGEDGGYGGTPDFDGAGGHVEGVVHGGHLPEECGGRFRPLEDIPGLGDPDRVLDSSLL
mmetsp:Transcript_40597/g.47500  ORF Transcript_40597/g.47500 Transcript_40597/m.47500 type:complete len:91 (+) Transcript_40597:53-325(+)